MDEHDYMAALGAVLIFVIFLCILSIGFGLSTGLDQ